MLLTFLFGIAFFISTSVCEDSSADRSGASTEPLLGSAEDSHENKSEETKMGNTTASPTEQPTEAVGAKPEGPLKRRNAVRRPHKKNKKSQEEEPSEPSRKPSKKEQVKDLLKKAADKARHGAEVTVKLVKKGGEAAGKKAKEVAEKAKNKLEKRKKRNEDKKKLIEE